MDQHPQSQTRAARLRALFFSTLYISAFTFGGGFVIVTFMKRKFVDELHWIDDQEMLDMAALAQSSPRRHRRQRRHPGGAGMWKDWPAWWWPCWAPSFRPWSSCR